MSQQTFFIARFNHAGLIQLVSLLMCFCTGTTYAAPSLVLRFDNVVVPVTDSTASLRLGITNVQDHIAGFELRLVLNRPDLAVFTGDFDTTGSVIGGWEYVWAETEDGGSKLHIAGLAEMFQPFNHQPVFPSEAERTLLRATLQIKPVPDTLTARTGSVEFDTSLQYFGFATDIGELIGLKADTTFDTLLFHCLQYDDTGCILWQQVWTEPYERIYVDTTLHPYLDTAYISLSPGQITVHPNCTPIQTPGDVNRDGIASEADLSALEMFVANGSPELPSAHNADLNGDSCVGVADIQLLARYLEFGPDSVTIAECAIQSPPQCCCVGKRGNVTGDPLDMVDLSDLSRLVAYLTGGGLIPCPKEADWNASGITDLTDLSSLVSYLIGAGGAASDCP